MTAAQLPIVNSHISTGFSTKEWKTRARRGSPAMDPSATPPQACPKWSSPERTKGGWTGIRPPLV